MFSIFQITNTSWDEGEPKVAVSGNGFIVVWRDDRKGYDSSDIWGARISGNGEIIDTPFVINSAPAYQKGIHYRFLRLINLFSCI